MQSPQKRSLTVKWYQFVTMVDKVQILRERAITSRYMHNAFLVILDVEILGVLFFFGKGTGLLIYEVMELLNANVSL
jgi:hypothetical protein